MGEFVRLEVEGGIGTIRLDWPKMNALNAAVQEGGPAMALRAAKEAIDRGLSVDLGSGLEIERTLFAGLFAGLFATRDREIGRASFIEHGAGKAVFTGR